jgi:type IV pilus assembly protein PilP
MKWLNRLYRIGLFTGPLGVLISLGGCGDASVNEVKQWMEATQKEVRPQVTPLSEPKKFIPFGYVNKAEVDPFNPNKLLGAIAKLTATTKKGPVIDESRAREFLEGFPLDTVKMVGFLEKKGVFTALVQIDKNVYQVKVGNYVGQNHGKIAKITESEIVINEIVQDATGDNIEHEAKLELQETKNDRSK